MYLSLKPKAVHFSGVASQSLILPAVRGLTFGFIGGIVVIAALSMLAPNACSPSVNSSAASSSP
jgi:hypothetical protein